VLRKDDSFEIPGILGGPHRDRTLTKEHDLARLEHRCRRADPSQLVRGTRLGQEVRDAHGVHVASTLRGRDVEIHTAVDVEKARMDACSQHPRDDADGDRAITTDDEWELSGPNQVLDGLGDQRCHRDDGAQVLRGTSGGIRPPANEREIAMVTHVEAMLEQQLEESCAAGGGRALLLTRRSSPGA
jgi:hypothetical protein